MRKAGAIAAEALARGGEAVKPGVSTKHINDLMEKFIRSKNAYPSFLHYNGFPATACISINDEVIHGIPSDTRIIQDGDIVSIDVGVLLNGYHGDNANTFPAGNVSEVLETTISMQQAAEITAVPTSDGTTLNVTGWAVSDDLIGLALKIGDKQPQVGEQVDASELAEMLSDYEARTGVAVNVAGKVCLRIEKQIDISDLPEGTQTISLVIDEFGSDMIELASATFEKTQSATIVPNTPVADADNHFAFGLDAQKPMDGKGILLTGWYYGSANNDAYTVSEVRVLETYADSNTNANDEIIERTEALPATLSLDSALSQGYTKLTRRDVSSVCPDSIRAQAGVDVPSEANAGFMIWIDSWSLEDGDYKVSVVMLCGGVKHYPSMQLSIRNGEPTITSTNLQAIAEIWNPQPVEEEALEEEEEN